MTWAEQAVPSGAASLVIATLPAWLLLLDWGCGGRSRPRAAEVLGIGLGLAGVATLSAPGGINPAGAAALLVAAVAWAVGSLFNRYADLPASPSRHPAMQMLAGGVFMVVLGLALGEAGDFDPARVSVESVAAFAVPRGRRAGGPAGVQLAVDRDLAGAGRDVRVRQPGGRGAARLGFRRRDAEPAERRSPRRCVVSGVMLLVWPRNKK